MVQIRSKTSDKNCISKANRTRDTKLLQTLFGTKISTACLLTFLLNFSFSFFESGGEDQEAPGSSQSQPSDSDAQSRLGNVSVNPGYSTNKEGNEYYAGGAQSGIGVMAPPTGKPVDNDQFVKDLFKVAKIL